MKEDVLEGMKQLMACFEEDVYLRIHLLASREIFIIGRPLESLRKQKAIVEQHDRIRNFIAPDEVKIPDYSQEFSLQKNSAQREIILINSDKEVTECITSNIFLLVNDCWVTAPTGKGVMDGICRRKFT